jgi:putative oxidoreductase
MSSRSSTPAPPEPRARWRAWGGHAWLALPVRLYLGYVFVWACWHKILDPGAFALDVATYQMLPLPLINVFALVLPWVELLAGAMLVVGLRVRAAALLVVGMMAAFMVALGWALHQGFEMSCGCFASASTESPISGWTMLRDAAWVALALYVLLFDHAPLGLDGWLRRRRARTPAPSLLAPPPRGG